ncbi:MAG: DUF6954 family protein [Bacillota bacterium]
MVIRNILIGVIGVFLGFFLVGPTVFADGPYDERLMAFGIIVIAYAVAGGLSGYFTGSWKSGIWMGLPGIIIGGMMSDALRVTIVVICIIILATLLGTYGGIWLKARQ